MKQAKYLIRTKSKLVFVTFVIYLILSSLMPKDIRCEEKANNKADILRAKVGLGLGLPHGLPEVHLEIGHPNLSAFFGAGLSFTYMLYSGMCELEGWPGPIVLSMGVVATPIPSKWALRPRVALLYTDESAYLHYHTWSLETGWRHFYEERFPGYLIVLDLEINGQKLGLPAYKNSPNITIELSYGINKPFKGWAAINRLREEIHDRISSGPDYYPKHCCARPLFESSFRIGLGYKFWSAGW